MTNSKINKSVDSLKGMEVIFTNNRNTKNLPDKAIEINNLNFYIKKRKLLNNISFVVKKGSIHGFLGPNGAGKTTTIKNIIGAYVTRNDDSIIKIFGIDADKIEAKNYLGYIPEYATFPKHLNVKQYLITMAGFSKEDISDAKSLAKKLLYNLGLEKHANINPNNFSSGMKKKVLLAQALMNKPSILILDEPAANLDPSARKILFDSLKLLAKKGITIFISSHILSEMEGFIDHMTLINFGNVVYSGSIKDVVRTNLNNETLVTVETNDSESVKKLIIGLKGTTRIIDGKIEARFKTKKAADKFIEAIGKNKIKINSIVVNSISVQSLYDDIFGGEM